MFSKVQVRNQPRKKKRALKKKVNSLLEMLKTKNGNLNTKLPISVNGKSCTGEYGCDDINNGDTVYVEGYNDTFKVTVYENNLFQYIPNL